MDILKDVILGSFVVAVVVIIYLKVKGDDLDVY